MTNSDNGEALYDEIKRSLSIEYGWIQDNTNLYIIIALSVMVIIVAGIVLFRWARKRRPAN